MFYYSNASSNTTVELIAITINTDGKCESTLPIEVTIEIVVTRPLHLKF